MDKWPCECEKSIILVFMDEWQYSVWALKTPQNPTRQVHAVLGHNDLLITLHIWMFRFLARSYCYIGKIIVQDDVSGLLRK